MDLKIREVILNKKLQIFVIGHSFRITNVDSAIKHRKNRRHFT